MSDVTIKRTRQVYAVFFAGVMILMFCFLQKGSPPAWASSLFHGALAGYIFLGAVEEQFIRRKASAGLLYFLSGGMFILAVLGVSRSY